MSYSTNTINLQNLKSHRLYFIYIFLKKIITVSDCWLCSISILSEKEHWTESLNFYSRNPHKENVKINYYTEFSDRHQFLTDFAPQGVEVVITNITTPFILCCILCSQKGEALNLCAIWVLSQSVARIVPLGCIFCIAQNC